MTIKQNLVDTLRSPPMNQVYFRYNGWIIAPFGFYIIRSAVIKDFITTKVNSKLPPRVGNYDPGSDIIFAPTINFGSTDHGEKSVLVHEAAHAYLDMYAGKKFMKSKHQGKYTLAQKVSAMKVLDNETIGYLAGAFYLVAAIGPVSSASGPEREAIKIATTHLKPKTIMKVNGTRKPPKALTKPFIITGKEAGPLRSAIQGHNLYKNNVKGNATLDGLKFPKRIGLAP